MSLMLKDVRLSFPVLWTPKEFAVGDGKPRYSAAFLVEPGSANDIAIRKAIDEAIAGKFDKAEKAKAFRANVEGQKNQWCYLPGDRKEYAGYAGCMVLSAHRKGSDGRPTVVGPNRAPLTEADGKPYAGCYVNAIVEVYVQPDGQNPGVRASFAGIQFSRDGEAFSGGAAASAEDFDDLTAGADAGDMI